MCLTCRTCRTCLTRWGARLRPDGLRRGKPCNTPRVCLPQSGMARVKSYRWGMQGNLMATGVCVLRERGACIRLIRLIRLIK